MQDSEYIPASGMFLLPPLQNIQGRFCKRNYMALVRLNHEFSQFLLLKIYMPHCNVIISTTRSPQAWKAKKNISKNSLRRGSVQLW